MFHTTFPWTSLSKPQCRVGDADNAAAYPNKNILGWAKLRQNFSKIEAKFGQK